MNNIPAYVSIIFGLTAITAVTLFYAASKSKAVYTAIMLWLLAQALVSMTGFYTDTHIMPPRFLLLVLPPLISIVFIFSTKGGQAFAGSLDIKMLTLLHTIRIPVELVLYLLFAAGVIPQLMTFEGRNFDIISGITAPLIYYYGFVKKRLNKNILIAWNLLCLALLLNIVINAVLSAPFPFQQFAFNQPNIAVFYFPYVWLPGCIVPLVLLSHLVAIKQLMSKK